MWEELGVSTENSLLQVCDHHTLSHKTTVDYGDRTLVAAVRIDCVVHCATWAPPFCQYHIKIFGLIQKKQSTCTLSTLESELLL